MASIEDIEEKMLTEHKAERISTHQIENRVNEFKHDNSPIDFELNQNDLGSSLIFQSEFDRKIQKPIIFSKFLPYSIDQDVERMYKEFVSIFDRALQVGDINMLVKVFPKYFDIYISVYGHYFTKEEHVRFIKVYLNILVDPGLEIDYIYPIIETLNILMKKVELLSPDDLQIEWRPLMETYKRLFTSKTESYGFVSMPNRLETHFQKIVKLCRIYFHKEATAEILDEIRPMLNPLDGVINVATFMLNLFLPISRSNVEQGYQLWFDDLLTFWKAHQTSPTWERHLLKLFARLASRTIGQIDWTPHIPMIFNHFIRSLELDGNNKKISIDRDHYVFDVHSASLWIVSMIGCGRVARSTSTSEVDSESRMEVDGCNSIVHHQQQSSSDASNEIDDVCLQHLENLIKSLESHYYPTNNSHQNIKLYYILKKLPTYLFKRHKLEKSHKKTWFDQVPSEFHLTDRHITKFVQIMFPVMEFLIHRKSFIGMMYPIFQTLAYFRPDLVVPKMLDHIWSSFDTLTEPHRLINCLRIGVYLAPIIVHPNAHFPQGQQYVFPLLMSALPGIDPNDSTKMFAITLFMFSFTDIISIVDCSSIVEHRNDLTEHEINACLSTAQAEQFVCDFIERCFRLIETFSNTHSHHQSEVHFTSEQMEKRNSKMDNEEFLVFTLIGSVFPSVLNHCSPAIFDVALDLIFNQLRNKIFGSYDAVKFASQICQALADTNPKKTLDKMMNHFIRLTMNLAEYEESCPTNHKLDDQIVLCMHLIAELCTSRAVYLIPYREKLEQLIDKMLTLKPKLATSLASHVLDKWIRQLVVIHPYGRSNLKESWDTLLDFEKCVPTRTWGYLHDINEIKFQWHIPSDNELQMAYELMQKYLLLKLDLLEKWANNQVQLNRSDVYKALNVISTVFTSCASVLPIWSDEPKELPLNCFIKSMPIKLQNSSPVKPFPDSPDGNWRLVIARKLLKIGTFMIENHEDDVRSFNFLMQIYRGLLLDFGISQTMLEYMLIGYHNHRFMYRFLGPHIGKRQPKSNLIHRVMIQHQYQLLIKSHHTYTETHNQIFRQLFILSTSRYAEIRKTAHEHLDEVSQKFYATYKTILPDLLHNFKTKEEHIYTGTLNVIQKSGMIRFNDYKSLRQMWLGFLNSTYFEKETIVSAIDNLTNYLYTNYNNIHLKYEMPESVQTLAIRNEFVANDQIEACHRFYDQLNNENEQEYWLLVDDLVNYLETGKAHWRFQEIAFDMLALMTRLDRDLSVNAVDHLMRNVNNDSLFIRKLCINSISRVLKMKPKPEKTTIMRIEQNHDFLLFPQASQRKEPQFYLHKLYYGFYEWPKNGCKVFQKCSTRDDFGLPAIETLKVAPIMSCLRSDAYLDKMIKFMCIEEKKDSDKFSFKRFLFFKEIFKHFGWSAYHNCLEKKLKYLILENVKDEDSHHRVAAEMFAGLMKAAARYWPEDEFNLLKQNLTENQLIRAIMRNLRKNVVGDWSTCFSKIFRSVDGRRLMFVIDEFIETLFEDFQLHDKKTSDIQCFQLICFTSILSRQNWRSVALSRLFVAFLDGSLKYSSAANTFEIDSNNYNCQTIGYLTRFQNLRQIVGNLISVLFRLDYEIPSHLAICPIVDQYGPSKQTFINDFLFAQVLKSDPNTYIQSPLSLETTDVEQKKHQETISNITKSVCNWLQNSFGADPNFVILQFFKFLPLFCDNQKRTETQGHDELKMQSFVSLMLLSQTFALEPTTIDFCLSVCERVVRDCSSWHARSAFCSFYQHWLTSNLFTLRPYEERIIRILDQLLHDSKIEVQEAASHTLSGLIHCQFISSSNLQQLIRQLCASNPEPNSAACTYRLLGLCALINASPYSIPDYLPDILIVLAQYVNQTRSPVYSLIKKTLSNFKRTHLDNWSDHKRKFTENQLAVITDILVSPSYYA